MPKVKGLIDEICFIDNFVYCSFKMDGEVSVHKRPLKEEGDPLFNSYGYPSSSVGRGKRKTAHFRVSV